MNRWFEASNTKTEFVFVFIVYLEENDEAGDPEASQKSVVDHVKHCDLQPGERGSENEFYHVWSTIYDFCCKFDEFYDGLQISKEMLHFFNYEHLWQFP